MAGSQVYMAGDHQAEADLDVFAVTVAAGQSLRVETIEPAAGPTFETCESNGLDTRLRVLTPDGSLLVTDDDDGRGFCSMADGRGVAPQDAALHNLAAGTYFVEVSKSTFANGGEGIFDYRLTISVE